MDARSRAVARLARWAGRDQQWTVRKPGGRLAAYAAWRHRRAAAHVDELAGRDVLAGHDVAGFVVPRRVRTDAELNHWVAAAGYYRAAVDRAHAAHDDHAAAGEGLQGQPEAPEVRGHDRRW